MILRTLFAAILLLVCSSCSTPGGPEFSTDHFRLALTDSGALRGLVDTGTGTDYLVDGASAPLLSLRIGGEYYGSESVNYNPGTGLLTLLYPDGIEGTVLVTSRPTHITFELVSISDPEGIELVVWGPYATSINKIIGETVGVVQGEEFTIGIQSLNPRTLGGYPWNENDAMPQLDIFESGDYSDLSEKGKRYVLYRVEAAKPDSLGSTLQAYTRNRNTERVIPNWNHDRYTAFPYDDGGIVGSKIALFGVPVEQTLDTIGDIELTEGLPHPMIDGVWGKKSRSASAAYIILGFGEDDIDRAIAVTKKAGLRYLYHGGPYETWGHFKLNEKQFPDGVESMKRVVDRAETEGIMVGTHILSNFITTNDPYVTPVPDDRLAIVGSSTLVEDISSTQTRIRIASPDFFNQFKNNNLKAVVVGDEIIRYGTITESEPWILLDCQRGAYGTTAESHASGDVISKLADHGYKVFLTNPELSIEMAGNIADLYNQTGLRQISFDGLEGNRSTGMGNYGEILFTQTWFDSLNDDIKGHYIADASRTSHYFWHMYTRMNWGEPWYAGFRESQTEYRLKNQKYFQRNLMPGMLGWFSMKAETSIEDIEWMLARSAAFNAGYSFVVSYRVLEENSNSDAILGLLGLWEQARMSGAFSDEQKTRMEDIAREFHLESAGPDAWDLYEIYTYKFGHANVDRQPGEPTHSTFEFENPVEEQPLQFILTASGGTVEDIRMELDNYRDIQLPVTLAVGEILQYTGGREATVHSSTWRELRRIEMSPDAFVVSQGVHTLAFDATVSGDEEARAKLELRLIGPAERLKPE